MVFAAQRMPVVVWLQRPEDEEMLTRVSGQTVDLEIELIALRTKADSPEALARSHGGRVVLWITEDGILHILDLASGKHLQRPLGTGGGASVRSTRAETAALLTRSALRAMLLTSAVLHPPPPAKQPPPKPAPPPKAKRPIGLHGVLGWQVGIDKGSDTLFSYQSGLLRLGLNLPRLVLDIGATLALPATLNDGESAVSLVRHRLVLGSGFRLPLAKRVDLLLSGSVGVFFYDIRTEALRSGIAPSAPQVVVSAALSNEVRLWICLARAVGVEVELGADLALGLPVLGYNEGGTFVARHRFWPVSPRFGLTLLIFPLANQALCGR